MRMKKFIKTVALALCLTMTVPVATPIVGVETVEAATKVKLNYKKKTIYVGDTFKLKITGTKKKVKWSSANKKIATVSSKGVVKGKKAGTTKVTATVLGKKYTCSVIVNNVLSESIELDRTPIECVVGEKIKVNVKILPSNTTNKKLQWTIDDESIAKVDTKGNVTGIASGETTLVVTNGNTTASCPVTVKDIFSYEFLDVENGTLVYATNNKASDEIQAVEFTIKYYDETGKMVYKNEHTTDFYHVEKNRVCSFFVEKPFKYQYAYYKVEAKEFGTINYKLDLYDKLLVNVSKGEENGEYCLNYTIENPTDEVIDYSEILFLCYKDGVVKNVIKINCDINVNTKKDGKEYISEMYDSVTPIISKAWVMY